MDIKNFDVDDFFVKAKTNSFKDQQKNMRQNSFIERFLLQMAEGELISKRFIKSPTNILHRHPNITINGELKVMWTFDLIFDTSDDLINLFNEIYRSNPEKRKEINENNIRFIEVFMDGEIFNIYIMSCESEDYIKKLTNDIASFFYDFRNNFEVSATLQSKKLNSIQFRRIIELFANKQ